MYNVAPVAIRIHIHTRAHTYTYVRYARSHAGTSLINGTLSRSAGGGERTNDADRQSA